MIRTLPRILRLMALAAAVTSLAGCYAPDWHGGRPGDYGHGPGPGGPGYDGNGPGGYRPGGYGPGPGGPGGPGPGDHGGWRGP